MPGVINRAVSCQQCTSNSVNTKKVKLFKQVPV
jgi:hypothetical protein